MLDYSSIKKLGFGLMRLPMTGDKVDIPQTKEMVDLFMEKGFTYFDTAYGYIDGKSEEAVKEALVSRYPRDSFQLATKLPAFSVSTEAEAKAMLQTSLNRTGAEYFDFYLLHNLSPERRKNFDDFGIWDFALEQKEKGIIKHLGFSMHASAEFLDEILNEHPEMEFVQLQINYADWESSLLQARLCYEVAVKHGKPIIIMEPVKGGLLAALPQKAADVLKAADPDASLASWAIRYAASLDNVITVLSGMSTIEQMQDNLSYMESFKPLTKEEYACIEKVQGILASVPQVPCTDCKYCVKDCPQNIAIPGIFKVYNDYLQYDNLDMVKGSYGWETNKNGKAKDCIACGLCESVCPQSIHIIDELAKASAVFDIG